MKNVLLRITAVTVLLSVTLVAQQGLTSDPQIQVLFKIFAKEPPPVHLVYDESFLKQVPEFRIREIVVLYKSKLGELKSVLGSGGSYDMIFEKGKAPCRIGLNAEGLVISLWFGNWVLFDDTLDSIVGEFKKLSGEVSICILKNGAQDVFSLENDKPLAVGSAFKLYILKTLVQKIQAGRARWSDVIRLDEHRLSLPSGMIQDWPAGSPLTLSTLANLMISISDNTATDHLLFYLGRENVEAEAPARLRPFLSTLEVFILKWGLGNEKREEYLRADLAGKRAILSGLAGYDRKSIIASSQPRFIDRLEWLLTTRELCQVIYELRQMPALSINPGLASKTQWHYVGYKGGSEPGVLNYTHLLQKQANAPFFSVSVTLNNREKEVQTQLFTELVTRLMALLELGKIG